MEWAHITHGRTRARDYWQWVVPHPGESAKSIKNTFSGMFSSLRGEGNFKKSSNEIAHVIGFDGKRWYTGSYATPDQFLNEATHNAGDYARDHVGRPTDWMHGFFSNAADSLESIPFLDKEGLRKLHETHIIPIWDDKAAKPVVSAFRNPEGMKAISEVVPPEALEMLQQAQKAGTPVFISFDPATQQWQNRTSEKFFQMAVEPVAEAATHTPPVAAAVSQTEQAAQKAGSGLLQALYHDGALTGKGKLAIAATALAAIGLTAAWVIHDHKAKNTPSTVLAESNVERETERVVSAVESVSLTASKR